jgi:hypothetical protein
MQQVAGNRQRRLFDRRGAADYLGLSVRKVDEFISTGVLVPVRLPQCGKTLIDFHDLQRLVMESKVQHESIDLGTTSA